MSENISTIALNSLSPSSINQLRECPRQWMYVRSETSKVAVEEKYLIFGRAVHSNIENYFNTIKQNPTPEIIKIQIDKAFEKWYRPEIKTMTQQYNTIKANFIKFELNRRKTWQTYKPTFVEKELRLKLWHDLPEFHIIIDFYSEPEKTIIDWKTGTVDMTENLMIQGKIYELALKAMGKPVEHVIFCALKQNTVHEVPKIQDGWVYKICHDTVNMIKAGHFPKHPTVLCNWCPFILNCEFDDYYLWDDV